MIDFPSRSRHEWVDDDKLVIEAEDGDIVGWFKEVWGSHREEIDEGGIESLSFEVVTKGDMNDGGVSSTTSNESVPHNDVSENAENQSISVSKNEDGIIEGPIPPIEKDGEYHCPIPGCDFSNDNKTSVSGHMSAHESEGIYRGGNPNRNRGKKKQTSTSNKSSSHLSEDDREFRPINEGTQKTAVVQLLADIAPNEEEGVTVDQASKQADPDEISISSLGSMMTKLYKWEWLDSNRENSPPYKYWLSEKGEVHLRDLQ